MEDLSDEKTFKVIKMMKRMLKCSKCRQWFCEEEVVKWRNEWVCPTCMYVYYGINVAT